MDTNQYHIVTEVFFYKDYASYLFACNNCYVINSFVWFSLSLHEKEDNHFDGFPGGGNWIGLLPPPNIN